MSEAVLPGWESQDSWFQREGRSFFTNRHQWDWFYRKHKRDLVKGEAIALLGRSVLVRPDRLMSLVEALCIDEARRRAGLDLLPVEVSHECAR